MKKEKEKKLNYLYINNKLYPQDESGKVINPNYNNNSSKKDILALIKKIRDLLVQYPLDVSKIQNKRLREEYTNFVRILSSNLDELDQEKTKRELLLFIDVYKKEINKDFELMEIFKDNVRDIIDNYPKYFEKIYDLKEEYGKILSVFVNGLSQDIDNPSTYKRLSDFLKSYKKSIDNKDNKLALSLIYTYLSVLLSNDLNDENSLITLLEHSDEFTELTGELNYDKMYKLCLSLYKNKENIDNIKKI